MIPTIWLNIEYTRFPLRVMHHRAPPPQGLPTSDPTTRTGDPAPLTSPTSGSSFPVILNHCSTVERPCGRKNDDHVNSTFASIANPPVPLTKMLPLPWCCGERCSRTSQLFGGHHPLFLLQPPRALAPRWPTRSLSGPW